MKARYCVGVVAVLVGSGCDGLATVSQLPATVRLRVGDEVRLPDQNLTLVLEEVIEDSRCPQDAICVWEGRVVVRLKVIRPNPPDAEILLDSRQPDSSAGVTLRILGVEPRPLTEVHIDQDEYRISLELTYAPSFNQ